MPVTKSRTAFYDINLDQANTTGFLFGDDDNVVEGKLYTQANNEDNFPVLRREPNMVSQSPASSIAATGLLSALSPHHIDTGKGCFIRRKVALKPFAAVWVGGGLVPTYTPPRFCLHP